MIGQLSTTTGLAFAVATWTVSGSAVWDAETPDGLTVSVVSDSVPTRVVISDDIGSRCFDSPTTTLGHLSETVSFALLAARFTQPTP